MTKPAFFYLYEVGANCSGKIADAIQICVGQPNFSQSDISVRWDHSQMSVGLLIGEVLWAAFDPGGNQRFGGDYRSDGTPDIPKDVIEQFAIRH